MPYLTPDTAPDETVCYTLRIPNDVRWVGIVKGAVSELVKAYNFEAFGTATPTETARRFLTMYEDFVFSECDMGCCYDTVDHRVTSDGGLEISINGGEWQQDPQDPRLTGTSLPAPVFDETHTKCDAASNGRQHFEDLVAAHSNDLGVATTAIELVGLIVVEIAALIFAPESAPLIVPILIASIIALFAFGKTAFDAYWVSDRYGEVLCALFCNIGDDGQFTDAGFAAFLAKYSTDLPASVAKDMLYRDMIACGVKGLNNMCAYGTSASADCSDCDCGDCDNLLDWSIFDDSRGSFGTITSRGSGELHLTASNAVDGTYYVVLTTGNADICCKIVDAYQPAGHAAAPSTAAYHACGETPGFAGAHAGHPESGAGTCVNFVYYNSVTAFDLVLVFENC